MRPSIPDPKGAQAPGHPESVVSFFRSECQEQPARLASLLQAYAQDGETRRTIDSLKKGIDVRLPFLWLGMGASYASALSGATKMTLSGRASFAIEASEWLHHALGAWDHVAGPMLVSTSGESAEIVELLKQAKDRSKLLLSNNDHSPSWALASLRFPLLAGVERANASKTYTNSCAACIIIASELAGSPWFDQAKASEDAVSESLEELFGRRQEMDEFCRGSSSIEVIGRGGALSGAIMGALSIREMTKIRATAHSGGAFRHGPSLDIDSTHLAIVLALGRTRELGLRLSRECLARGGKVVLVTDRPGGEKTPSERFLRFEVAPVPEPWEALTSVLPCQALTLALIERLGSSYVRVQTTSE